MTKPKRLLKDFLRNTTQEYCLYTCNDNNVFVQINAYSSLVNVLAAKKHPMVIQCRDIVFCGADRIIKPFIEELEQYGYKINQNIMAIQLELEGKLDYLEDTELLRDWLIGDEDIMF